MAEKTLAKYANGQGMTDLRAILVANSQGIQIRTLSIFNHMLLETSKWQGEKELYPAYSNKFVILESKDKKIGKSGIIERTYDIDGIRRVANLNDLGLSQYIGEKNTAFFTGQNPMLANGKPNIVLTNENGDIIPPYLKLKPGSTVLVKVNDLNTIVAVSNMPRDGERLSPYDYGRVVGAALTNETWLKWRMSDSSNIRLLTRNHVDGFSNYGRHLVNGGSRVYLFGVSGDIVAGAAAPAVPHNWRMKNYHRSGL